MQWLDNLAYDQGLEVDEATMADAHFRLVNGYATEPEEALFDAIEAAAFRDLEDAAAETGTPDFAMDDAGRRWEEEINYDDAAAEGTGDFEADSGGGPSGPDAGDAGARGALAQELEADPESAGFADPTGPTGPDARAQADSLTHDLAMEAAGEAPDAAARADQTFRLDEDGDEIDIASVLDELDEAERAVDEMRQCMTPPKGGGE